MPHWVRSLHRRWPVVVGLPFPALQPRLAFDDLAHAVDHLRAALLFTRHLQTVWWHVRNHPAASVGGWQRRIGRPAWSGRVATLYSLGNAAQQEEWWVSDLSAQSTRLAWPRADGAWRRVPSDQTVVYVTFLTLECTQDFGGRIQGPFCIGVTRHVLQWDGVALNGATACADYHRALIAALSAPAGALAEATAQAPHASALDTLLCAWPQPREPENAGEGTAPWALIRDAAWECWRLGRVVPTANGRLDALQHVRKGGFLSGLNARVPAAVRDGVCR